MYWLWKFNINFITYIILNVSNLSNLNVDYEKTKYRIYLKHRTINIGKQDIVCYKTFNIFGTIYYYLGEYLFFQIELSQLILHE